MTTTEEKQDILEKEISLGKDISIINLVDCLVEKAHRNREPGTILRTIYDKNKIIIFL